MQDQKEFLNCAIIMEEFQKLPSMGDNVKGVSIVLLKASQVQGSSVVSNKVNQTSGRGIWSGELASAPKGAKPTWKMPAFLWFIVACLLCWGQDCVPGLCIQCLLMLICQKGKGTSFWVKCAVDSLHCGQTRGTFKWTVKNGQCCHSELCGGHKCNHTTHELWQSVVPIVGQVQCSKLILVWCY